MKTIELPDHTLVTRKMVLKLDHLLFSSHPTQLKNHLVTIFMKYLECEHETLPLDFEERVVDLTLLIEFLIVAEREMEGNG
ncbi:MAG: hypothetical protein RIM99_15990 [Cyclobacteriaceae bacterium]